MAFPDDPNPGPNPDPGAPPWKSNPPRPAEQTEEEPDGPPEAEDAEV